MKVRIEFNCDNAAFEKHTSLEIAATLRALAEVIKLKEPSEWPIVDINGNTIGKYQCVEEDE